MSFFIGGVVDLVVNDIVLLTGIVLFITYPRTPTQRNGEETQVTCRSPPVIPNAQGPPPTGPFPVGSSYRYTSYVAGYSSSGDPSTTCQADGQWSPVVFQCRALADCSAVLRADSGASGNDGVYTIIPDGTTQKQVFCDMTTKGGGWTVIQRREDQSTDFYRTWEEYKAGCGNPAQNHWIGNEALYHLTKGQDKDLVVNLQRFNGQKAEARYTTFYIGDENSKYLLTVSSFSSSG
ncbi:ryncolin-1-like, partial [Saccostrea cucullata]|uniref:ryncolin-1-like n=1 Tax=Saccostrea cuccullata TaxID=36930 RepID=UPI002ED14905